MMTTSSTWLGRDMELQKKTTEVSGPSRVLAPTQADVGTGRTVGRRGPAFRPDPPPPRAMDRPFAAPGQDKTLTAPVTRRPPRGGEQ